VWVCESTLHSFWVTASSPAPPPPSVINLLPLRSFIHACAHAELVLTEVSGCTVVSLTVCLPPALQGSQTKRGPSLGDSVGKHVCRPGLLEVSYIFASSTTCVLVCGNSCELHIHVVICRQGLSVCSSLYICFPVFSTNTKYSTNNKFTTQNTRPSR
jgi:hypothetical protein